MNPYKQLLAIAETPEQMNKLMDWWNRNVKVAHCRGTVHMTELMAVESEYKNSYLKRVEEHVRQNIADKIAKDYTTIKWKEDGCLQDCHGSIAVIPLLMPSWEGEE